MILKFTYYGANTIFLKLYKRFSFETKLLYLWLNAILKKICIYMYIYIHIHNMIWRLMCYFNKCVFWKWQKSKLIFPIIPFIITWAASCCTFQILCRVTQTGSLFRRTTAYFAYTRPCHISYPTGHRTGRPLWPSRPGWWLYKNIFLLCSDNRYCISKIVLLSIRDP